MADHFFFSEWKSCIPLSDSFFVRYFFLSSVGAHLCVIFPQQLWNFSSLLFPFESVFLRCFRVYSAELSLTIDNSPSCHWISVSFSMFETFLLLCTWANWAFTVEIIPNLPHDFSHSCVHFQILSEDSTFRDHLYSLNIFCLNPVLFLTRDQSWYSQLTYFCVSF